MKKISKNLSFVIVFLFIILVIFLGTLAPKKDKTINEVKKEDKVTYNDFKNATYIIEGQEIKLRGGVSEVPIVPNSASMIKTKYFGNDVKYDWNNDGYEDVAFLLTQNDGGSGTFYYVVVALYSPFGYYTGSNAFFLGDRITPQSLEVQDSGMIVFNYLDRNEGESFATKPTFAKSTWLTFDIEVMDFDEYAPDFF